ncbi:MAG: winged helix-turn-helix domain-containing protein [Clostridium sp.]
MGIKWIWGAKYHTIAVYIKRIREKLSSYNLNYIKTVWGVGYKWEEDLDK